MMKSLYFNRDVIFAEEVDQTSMEMFHVTTKAETSGCVMKNNNESLKNLTF